MQTKGLGSVTQGRNEHVVLHQFVKLAVPVLIDMDIMASWIEDFYSGRP